ncbi:hypothetical protein QUB80_09440 [Chlorogloeopsis sp. ULAP01]|nr:hypothetical protein [Chlorogloeopsis sp. ULAP01]MDM9380926.1 hypothetical protein [Chlorogloeopsis sp. ULAP01]
MATTFCHGAPCSPAGGELAPPLPTNRYAVPTLLHIRRQALR